MPPRFDKDAVGGCCVGNGRSFPSVTGKTSSGKLDCFNKEEQQFLTSLNHLVNNTNYASGTADGGLWTATNGKYSGRNYEAILAELAGKPRVRSNSFHELRDLELSLGLLSAAQARDRHKSLAYGVSAADLGVVVNPLSSQSALTALNFLKASGLPDITISSSLSPSYEQAANVAVVGSASAFPLSGFKSEMSTALANLTESNALLVCLLHPSLKQGKLTEGEVSIQLTTPVGSLFCIKAKY